MATLRRCSCIQVRCWDDGRVLISAQQASQDQAGAGEGACSGQHQEQQQQQQQQAGSLWGMAPVEKVGGSPAAAAAAMLQARAARPLLLCSCC
jgi:hypothetical protein